MTLRSDHIAGSALVVFGLLVIALSGDLPVGNLSMPGAGFLPILVAVFTIVFGLALFVRASESAPFSSIGWSDGNHASRVIVIVGLAIALYNWLGFVITMVLMMLGLLVVIERRNIVRAAVYSVVVIAVTFGVFEYVLKTPLAEGPFGF